MRDRSIHHEKRMFADSWRVVLRSQPDRSLRVIGVLLVVLGFSFDLHAT